MTSETRELFEDLTLYAVAAIFIVSTIVGYAGGDNPESIILRALIAATAIGFIAWFLTWILASMPLQTRLPEGEATTDIAAGVAPPSRDGETVGTSPTK